MLLTDIKNYLYNIIKVVGKYGDNYSNASTWGYIQRMEKHNHAIGYVYPSLANGITLTGGSSAWQLGNFVEIVPTNGIDDEFDIHWTHCYEASVTDEFQVNLYKGELGSEILISEIPIERDATQSGSAPNKTLTSVLPANTRISAKMASKSGGSDTIKIKLQYHKY